jgi:hypothetical protein
MEKDEMRGRAAEGGFFDALKKGRWGPMTQGIAEDRS